MTTATVSLFSIDPVDQFIAALDTEPLPGKHRLASANTKKAYRSALEHFARWFLQTNGLDVFTPADVTREDVRDYVAALRRRYKPSTIHARFAALSAFFAWAQANGLYPQGDLPTDGVPLPSSQPQAPKGLDKYQRRALLRALNKLPDDTPTRRLRAARDRALVLTMLFVGLRVSEVVALRLANVTLRDRSGEIHVVGGKGNKDRTVAVSREARRALAQWLEVRPQTNHDFVFVDVRPPYHPLSVRSVQNVVRAIGKAAGLDYLTPHMLRHTTVYMWRERGVDPFTIAAQMGHQSIQTTQRYGRPRLTDLHRAVAAVDGEDMTDD